MRKIFAILSILLICTSAVFAHPTLTPEEAVKRLNDMEKELSFKVETSFLYWDSLGDTVLYPPYIYDAYLEIGPAVDRAVALYREIEGLQKFVAIMSDCCDDAIKETRALVESGTLSEQEDKDANLKLVKLYLTSWDIEKLEEKLETDKKNMYPRMANLSNMRHAIPEALKIWVERGFCHPGERIIRLMY